LALPLAAEEAAMKLIHIRWFRGSNWHWATILALLVLPFLPNNLAAQGLPVETGSHVSVALMFAGAIVLGLVITGAGRAPRSRLPNKQRRTFTREKGGTGQTQAAINTIDRLKQTGKEALEAARETTKGGTGG
jgi:hypothetical protein